MERMTNTFNLPHGLTQREMDLIGELPEELPCPSCGRDVQPNEDLECPECGYEFESV